MLEPLFWRRKGVAFLQHRQAKATVSHLCVEGGGQIDEVRL